MALSSMTGFATIGGVAEGLDWMLEARSVNGRGLDIRMRLPDGLEALEPAIRSALQGALTRGSVQISLKLGQAESGAGLAIGDEALEALLDAAEQIAEAAAARGVALQPASVGDLLAHRSLNDTGRSFAAFGAVSDAVKASLGAFADRLVAARRDEGASLAAVLSGQLDKVDHLIGAAEAALGDRQAAQAKALRSKVAALLETQDRIDEDRLAQELALIAVKSDISEEIDRLRAHVAQARGLIAKGGAVGRKLDFLMQEFNREANTLCSKSQDAALTEAGLELKVVIDQMREQAANIE